MSVSLYHATVPTYQQLLGAVARLLTRAETHCRENDLPDSALIAARLADDMLPFCYQVKSTAVHSIGAIEGVRRGVFSPDLTPPPETFAELAARVDAALEDLAAVTPDEVNGFVGRDMRFEMGERRLPFTAEDFLLSFSLPNFYFHATTAYDILRWQGVTIGKRDFLGRLRLRPEAG